jgi:hypothetical protein
VIGFIGCKENVSKTPFVDKKLSSLHIKQAFDKKNKWLVNNDLDSLKTVIHSQAQYGHSNCWVQDYDDIVNANPKDSLVYIAIESDGLDISVINGTGIVIGNARFHGMYKQDTFDMNLCFVETYAFVDEKWMLVGRQSAKVPKK